jgi:hypothetical protein
MFLAGIQANSDPDRKDLDTGVRRYDDKESKTLFKEVRNTNVLEKK